MIAHTVFLYFFLYHEQYYTTHREAGQIKKAPSEDGAFESRTVKPRNERPDKSSRCLISFAFAQDDIGTSK